MDKIENLMGDLGLGNTSSQECDILSDLMDKVTTHCEEEAYMNLEDIIEKCKNTQSLVSLRAEGVSTQPLVGSFVVSIDNIINLYLERIDYNVELYITNGYHTKEQCEFVEKTYQLLLDYRCAQSTNILEKIPKALDIFQYIKDGIDAGYILAIKN